MARTALILLPFFWILLAGIVWRIQKGKEASLNLRLQINSLVLQLLLPALAFEATAHIPQKDWIQGGLWKIPVISLGVALGCLATTYGVYRALAKALGRQWNRSEFFPFLLAASFCNATYLGIPVVSAVVGEDYKTIPLLYDLLALTPLLLLVTSAGFKRLVRIPAFWALIIGMALSFSPVKFFEQEGFLKELIESFYTACRILGKLVAALMIFSVGLALPKPKISAWLWVLPAVSIRLLMGPLLARYSVTQAGLSGPFAQALIIEGAMPTMVLTLAMAEAAGWKTEHLSQAIFLSTLLSFLTLGLFLLPN